MGNAAVSRGWGPLLFAVLTATSGSTLVGAIDYYAFGDSVTRGEGAGFSLDEAAGTDCLTANLYPSKCGYHWRLEDSLEGAGVDANVRNRGIGGETTAEGMSRIDSVLSNRCTAKNAADVLLLMEGTNDISQQISFVSIEDNLTAMLNKARNKCVHAAIASTIRRLAAGAPPGSTQGAPNHQDTRDLKNLIRDLAALKNRAFVNPYAVLCPNQTCFDAHYWPKFLQGDPGHIDASGYNIMAPLFHDVIVAQALPAAPAPMSPSGDITNTTPLFTWSSVSGADWYFLSIDGGAHYGRWQPEEEICSGTTCSFDPGLDLTAGNHSWELRARNLRGNGGWSASQPFTVWTEPPGAATPGLPGGNECVAATPFAVTYTWDAAAGATNYDLEVEDASAAVVTQASYDAGLVCSGSDCSVAHPAPGLDAGSYRWRVRGVNPAGEGPWTAKTEFSVYPDTLVPATLTYPLESTFDPTPTFRWFSVSGAADYDLEIDANPPTNYPEEGICSSGLCEVTEGSTLAPGGHSWRVRANNPCTLAWSGPIGFDVLVCDSADPLELPATMANGIVEESDCQEIWALEGYVIQPGGDVTFHAGQMIRIGNGFIVESGGSLRCRVDY
jgi:lysophospholipase L1-like esterase